MANFVAVPNIYNHPHEKLFDGNVYLPKEIGTLKLLRRESREQITYYDWDLSFVNPTLASRPDNFGNDEIQVIFNLNQPIEWQIAHSCSDCEIVKMLPGEVCVFRNNDYQTSMQYDDSVNFKFKSLQMNTSHFESLLSKYFPKEQIELCKNVFLTHVTKTVISPDMYHVLSEIDGSEKFHEFKGIYLEAKMIELIALVLNDIFYEKIHLSPRSADSDTTKVESLRQRIQFNPADEYNAPQLAKSLCMSESKLTRLFRALYGISLHQYVKNQRLEKAALLLSLGEMNITEIAVKCGYNNMSHFSKEFQKRFGVVPSKFNA